VSGEVICKKCSALPKEEKNSIQQEDEIFGYLQQFNISRMNLTRLRTLSTSSNNRIADLAKIALEVGLVKPYKWRRLKFLSRNRMDLLIKLEETDLIDANHF